MGNRTRRIIVAALLLLVVAVGATAFGLFDRSVVTSDLNTSLTPEQMRGLVDKGRYLVAAADCFPCHTQKKGPAWTGGVAFETPVGTVYSSNITPDRETGLGSWTRAEFHRAVRDGIGKDGRHLLPAMPYASYRLLQADDVDAMYAYLMTREPIHAAAPPNTLRSPAAVGALMPFWNLLNRPAGPASVDTAHSADWNRGAYLVNALGHCGECHTPRNMTYGLDDSRRLQGAEIENMEAPAITAEALAHFGFTPDELTAFMRTGLARQGAMTNAMFDVVHFSTQHLDAADVKAMAVYLMGDKPPQPSVPPPVALDAQTTAAGQQIFLNMCAGCHGSGGEGVPHVSVPLRSNSSLRLADGRNLLRIILNGIPGQSFPGLERMQPMPGFSDKLSDQEISQLANWLRATWGGQPARIDAAAVRAHREIKQASRP